MALSGCMGGLVRRSPTRRARPPRSATAVTSGSDWAPSPSSSALTLGRAKCHSGLRHLLGRRSTGSGGDAVGAGEPSGEMSLVREAGLGGCHRWCRAFGEERAGSARPQIAWVVTGCEAVRHAEAHRHGGQRIEDHQAHEEHLQLSRRRRPGPRKRRGWFGSSWDSRWIQTSVGQSPEGSTPAEERHPAGRRRDGAGRLRELDRQLAVGTGRSLQAVAPRRAAAHHPLRPVRHRVLGSLASHGYQDGRQVLATMASG